MQPTGCGTREGHPVATSVDQGPLHIDSHESDQTLSTVVGLRCSIHTCHAPSFEERESPARLSFPIFGPLSVHSFRLHGQKPQPVWKHTAPYWLVH